jgi:hypothetical protein
MTWTNPRTWNVREINTAAWMNTYVRDNQNHLFDLFVPAGVIIMFNGAVCPSGYVEETTIRGRLIVGLPAGGTLAGTVGAALGNNAVRTVTDVPAHTHTTPGATTSSAGAHTHNVLVGTIAGTTHPLGVQNAAGAGGFDSSSDGDHTHPVSGVTNSPNVIATSVAHPYLQLLMCRRT